jgi:putative DNA primase/helicase
VGAYGIRHQDGKLLLPVTRDGQLWSLQIIDAEGNKRFLKHGRTGGCYLPIGTPEKTLWLCEGYATAAGVHEATGDCAVVAFNAGNLVPVARLLVNKFKFQRVVIAADNDDPGIKGAEEALCQARASGWIMPPRQGGIVDWNDHAVAYGLEATREQLLGVYR